MPTSPAVERARVVRLADSLLLSLPASVVDALDLRDGDELEVSQCATHGFQVHRATHQGSLERLRRFRGRLPAGFFARVDGDAHG
ncbi:hypothetical protein [Chitinasiproducens palmae]|nr:hypothetical protein [Chitinasiproducens palmae]